MQQINSLILSQRVRSRKGFSLVELILVIFIISLVYFLGFNGLEKLQTKPKALIPLNLKSILAQTPLSDKMTLMCVDECRRCYLRKGFHESFKPYENAIDLKGTQAYTLNALNTLTQIKYGRYKDDKICLILDFYPNGSSTPIILEQKGKSYYLPSFFGEPKETESAEKAKEIWLQNSEIVSKSGEFY